jgi:hypothetical protein
MPSRRPTSPSGSPPEQQGPLVSTSLRVPQNLLERCKVRLSTKRKSMNALLLEQLEDFAKGIESTANASKSTVLTPVETSQLADVFANSIADVLRRDISWAHTILRSAKAGWPGGILDVRMSHNAAEKDMLGRTFSEWLCQRITHHLKDGDVTLLVDAGSTNLYLCRHLWDHLVELSKQHRNTRLTLITNNEPVAEAFAVHGAFSVHRKQGIVDGTLINCILLGGRVEPEYGALVGDLTLENLKTLTTNPIPSPVRGQDQPPPPVSPLPGSATPPRHPRKIIALAAGNFVRLSGNRPAYPIPLVRGVDQRPIKELYIRLADEVFILSPLSKLFLESTDVINVGMGFSKDLGPEEQPYEDVDVTTPIDGQPEAPQPSKIKLVTTYRKRGHLLSGHSAAVLGQLAHPLLADDVSPEPDPTTDITHMGHICYVFEKHLKDTQGNDWSREDEEIIELPHKRTRTLEFKRKFYRAE